MDKSSSLNLENATTQLIGSGQQAKLETHEPVVKAEHQHDVSRPLSPLTPDDASQSGRNLGQTSLHSFFRVKKHGVGAQDPTGAEASAPTTTNDDILSAYGVLQSVATGNSQNGCNVPRPIPRQDTKDKATATSHVPGTAISEGGAERTRPSPHRRHSQEQTQRASPMPRKSPDAHADSPDEDSCYDCEDLLIYGQ